MNLNSPVHVDIQINNQQFIYSVNPEFEKQQLFVGTGTNRLNRQKWGQGQQIKTTYILS